MEKLSAGNPHRNNRTKIVRKILKILFWIIAIPLFLVIFLAVLLYLPPVQTFIKGKFLPDLEAQIGTPLQLESIRLKFPLGLSLNGLYVEDQQGDTLIFAENISASANLIGLLNNKLEITPVSLEGAVINLKQDSDSLFNFNYIIDSFSTETESEVDTSGSSMMILFDDLQLEDIRFSMNMKPSGMDLKLSLEELSLDFENFNLEENSFRLDNFQLTNFSGLMYYIASEEKEPDPYPFLQAPFENLDISFQDILFEDISFIMVEKINGDSMDVFIHELAVSANEVKLSEQLVDLDEIEIHQPKIGIYSSAIIDTVQAEMDTLLTSPPWTLYDDAFRYFIRDWKINVEEIQISELAFASHSGNEIYLENSFDPNHIEIRQSHISVSEVNLENERIYFILDQFQLESAFTDPVELNFVFEATPQSISILDFQFAAAGSNLTAGIHTSFSSLTDLYNNLANTQVDAEVNGEIAFPETWDLLKNFNDSLPSGDGLNEDFNLSMVLQGGLNNLEDVTINLQGNEGSVLQLNGNGSNLHTMNERSLFAEIQNFTMGTGMYRIAGKILPPETTFPERLTISGNASQQRNKGRGNFIVKSNLGDANLDINLSGLDNEIPDFLDFNVKLHHVDLAKLTGDTAMSAYTGTLKGRGLNMNSTNRIAFVELETDTFMLGEHNLADFYFAGIVRSDTVLLDIALEEEPADFALNLKGNWPINTDSIIASLKLNLSNIALEELGILDYPLNVEGYWEGDVEFNTSGDLQVNLQAPGLSLNNGSKSYTFEQFSIDALLLKDTVAFSIESDGIMANYASNVPRDSILTRTGGKIKSYFQPEDEFVSMPDRRVEFYLEFPETEWLTGLVLPQLEVIIFEGFSGSYDSNTDILDANLGIPELVYGDITITNLGLDINAKGDDLQGLLSVQRAAFDSLYIEGLSLSGKAANKALETVFQIAREGQDPTYYLMAEIKREGDYVSISLGDEQLILNNTSWSIAPENLIRFSSEEFVARDFKLRHEEQVMELKTENEYTSFLFDEFRIATILNFISTEYPTQLVRGRIDGEINIPQNREEGLMADIGITNFRWLENPIGDIFIEASNERPDLYKGTFLLEHPDNNLGVDFSYLTTGENAGLTADADINFRDLHPYLPFLNTVLYDLKGGLNGDISIEFSDKLDKLNGNLNFNNTEVGVIAANSRFVLPDERISLDENGLHLNNFGLRDSLGNEFNLNGDILTDNFIDYNFKLGVNTDKFQLLNSTRDDNNSFYGILVASADLQVTGTDVAPTVSGSIGILEGTDFFIELPGSEIEMVSSEGIVIFTEGDSQLDSLLNAPQEFALADSIASQLPGLDLDLNISLNENAKFTAVIDPASGDRLNFQGKGNLDFSYAPNQDINLAGILEAVKGSYQLSFYGLVKKQFSITPGSTITWNGQIMEARIDFQAIYAAQTSPYPLMAGTSTAAGSLNRNELQQRLPFEVAINIKGTPTNPDIDFGLDLREDYRTDYPSVTERLDQLKSPDQVSERNKQVFGLLVMGSFIQTSTGNDQQPGSNMATTAARNSVNGILTDQLNKLTGKYLKGVDISLGINSYDQYGEAGSTYTQTAIDYNVSKSFMDERLTFEVGGTVGVDNEDTDVTQVSSTRQAEYAIIYALTEDGRYKIKGFYENSYDLFDGELQQSGAAFMFNKDYNPKRRREKAEFRKLANEQQIEKSKAKEQEKEKEEKEKLQKRRRRETK